MPTVTRRKTTIPPTEEIAIPHAEATERAVLGCLIMEEKGLVRALEANLKADHFYINSHKQIFLAMMALHSRYGCVELQQLTDYLRTQHQLERIGGMAKLAELIDGRAPSLTTLSGLIQQLNDVFFKRETLKKAQKLIEMSTNGATPADIQTFIGAFEYTDAQTLAYAFSNKGLIFKKPARYGISIESELLTNFNAKIVSEQIEDDGSLEETRIFEIEAEISGQAKLIRVPSSKFGAMQWPTALLGAKAIVLPNKADQARAAIQILSGSIRQLTVYTHTGWRQIDDDWSFLHLGGAITPKGSRTDVTVRLPESLRSYHLPEPPDTPETITAAYEHVLSLLNAFNHSLTVPLIGANFAAVLGSIDYSVYFTGQSGTRKSELTSLGQAFWGSGFNRLALPANWGMDSPIALLLKAFRAKDAVMVVDDFAPNGQKVHDDKLHAKAEDVLRAAGNNAGRSTARADHSERAAKPPRCLIVSSGEEIPRGLSLQNRMLIVPMQLGDIPNDPLSEMQAMAREGKFALANAIWIQHVAKYRNSVLKRFQRNRLRFRDRLAATNKQHSRQPTTIAHVLACWNAWTFAAVVDGALTRREARRIRKQVWIAMTSAMATQKEMHTTTHPADYFLELLRSAMLSGRCHLATIKGLQPEGESHLLGWRNGVQQGDLVGWIENGLIYLEQGAAYNAANKQGIAQGEGLPVAKKTLWARMDEKGLIFLKEKGYQARTPITRVFTVVIAENSLFPE